MPGLRIILRYRLPRSRMHRFVFGSLVTHGVAAIVLLTLPALRGSDAFKEPGMPVMLVAAVPVDLPRVQQPKPEPPVATPKPRTEKPRPEAPPPLEPTPAPEPATSVANLEPAVEEIADPAPGEADAGPAEETADAAGAVTASIGGTSEFAWYRTSVTAALHSHWRKPILAGLREPREVVVEFEILRDGTVAGVRIAQSSGVPTLDRSALRAVQDASPLPPLPASWAGSTLPAGFTFVLFPE